MERFLSLPLLKLILPSLKALMRFSQSLWSKGGFWWFAGFQMVFGVQTECLSHHMSHVALFFDPITLPTDLLHVSYVSRFIWSSRYRILFANSWFIFSNLFANLTGFLRFKLSSFFYFFASVCNFFSQIRWFCSGASGLPPRVDRLLLVAWYYALSSTDLMKKLFSFVYGEQHFASASIILLSFSQCMKPPSSDFQTLSDGF